MNSDIRSLLIVGSIIFLAMFGYFLITSNSRDNDNLPIDINQDSKESQLQNEESEISKVEDNLVKNENMNESKSLPVPEMLIDQSKDYKAILKTSKGDIEIDLNEKETPITVNNFVYLARNNFYNDVIFHRVISGFMIQGGDPTGTGMGDPGYKFDDEPFTGEYTRGTVAMANSGPDTNGSQFFIMHQDTPLPQAYVVFGKVLKGMDVVDAIATDAVTSNGSDPSPSKPVNPTVIQSVEIIEE